jgi:hypothetical protein
MRGVAGRAAAAGVLLAAAAFAGEAPKARHPRFDDQGTLSWSEKLADAQEAAKAAGKLIFIEYGRES